MWCVAELNAEYIAKMEDVLALYERPYSAREPVVCLDEKPVSLHAEVQPPRPARPGHIAKRDSEYRRCGTANVFAVVEPKIGRHFTCATPNRSAHQFACVVRRMVLAYPRARTIHLVMDNLNIHCEKSLTDAFGEREGRRVWRRLAVHFTPKHGSWLNQAEIELSLVSRGCLGRRRIDALPLLRAEIRAWTTRANRARTNIQWRFTRTDARRKFGYQTKLSTRSQA
jgi:signal recognition particle subunit SEC65